MASFSTPEWDLNAPAARVDDAVSNEDSTSIREGTVEDVSPDSRIACEVLDTRIKVCNTAKPKSFLADPDHPAVVTRM